MKTQVPTMSLVARAPETPVREENRRDAKLVVLDALRGLLAIYVAVYHSIDLLTATGREFHSRGGAVRVLREGNLLGLFGFGYYAVLAFFVLSGFVIHLRQAQRPDEWKSGSTSWIKSYVWRRSTRIYPPLLVALLLTALLGFLGPLLSPDLYGHVLDHPTGSALVDEPGTVRNAVGVVLPAHGPAGFGSNGSLWSIGYELWFYALYVPLYLLVMARRRVSASRVLTGGLLLSAAVWAVLQLDFGALAPVAGLMKIVVYFPAWMAGAWLAERFARGDNLRRPRSTAAAALAMLLTATTISDNAHQPTVDILWCASIVAALSYALLRPQAGRLDGPIIQRISSTGSWSYSLYLVHMPVLLFAYGVLGNGTEPLRSFHAVTGCLIAALGVAWLLYQFVERPSISALVRRRPRFMS